MKQPVYLSMPTYPRNLKATLILRKNGSLLFGMLVDFFYIKKFAEEGKGFKFKCLSERGQPTPFSDREIPRICIDLRGSRSKVGSQAAPFAPSPVGTPMISHHRHLSDALQYLFFYKTANLFAQPH